MGPRQTRANSRREESTEPQEDSPVMRQTRSSSKRADALDSSQSKPTYHLESGIPQRGTRRQRRRRRSVESVATADFPKSSAERVSPDPPSMGATPILSGEDVAAAILESQSDSYEDSAARLQDILDFDLPKLRRWCEKTFEALSSLTSPEPTVEEHPLSYCDSYYVAFCVRCRRLVELLGEEPEAEPHALATTIFCNQSTNTLEEAMQWLRKGPYRKLGGTNQSGDFTSLHSFKRQMAEITDNFLSAERPRTDELLDREFPRDKLFKTLWTWALDMYTHVNENADKNNPPLEDHNPGRPDDGAEREGSAGLSRIEEDQSEASSDSGSKSEHEYQTLKIITKEPSFIQNPATLAAVRQSERDDLGRLRAQPPSNQQSARAKMTGLQIKDAILQLDAADILGPSIPDAENVGGTIPRDTRVSHSHPSFSPRPGSQELGSTGKRPRPEEDDDNVDDLDDDFEVNEQLMDDSRRIRAPSPDDAPTSSNIREKDIVMLNDAARANRFANRSRGHQTRERWTDADTDRLIDLIANPNLGCSWAAMEKEAHFQTWRSQQAIRDKARNLKKAYLCADAILPSGFDYVYLSKKERDDVIASGRNPDRREDDIDEDGRVTRNIWRESPS
ncbi:hypothetical protein ONZ43_g5475 [Nemania bipapillata]|uniref:Uncharacterized protein n=1 Tax=Nemania bipapillata TaxID=110536 RepID=A0ACC2IA77_9PEZI|nr:hypothetical protein ONZ43_g5475 [Nemania bipapillata]